MDRFRAVQGVPVAAYFERLRLRRSIIENVEAAGTVDAIIYPTVSIIPPRLTDLADDAAYAAAKTRAYRNAGIANLLDGCAITIPYTSAGTAPVGLTLTGRTGTDLALLALAEQLEPIIRGLD